MTQKNQNKNVERKIKKSKTKIIPKFFKEILYDSIFVKTNFFIEKFFIAIDFECQKLFSLRKSRFQNFSYSYRNFGSTLLVGMQQKILYDYVL